jgi:hypothetical protein
MRPNPRNPQNIVVNAAALQDHYAQIIKAQNPLYLPESKKPRVFMNKTNKTIQNNARNILRQMSPNNINVQKNNPERSNKSNPKITSKIPNIDSKRLDNIKDKDDKHLGQNANNSLKNEKNPSPFLLDKLYLDSNNIKTSENLNIEKKWLIYSNSLSLAQRLGLVPAAPEPISKEKWESIEKAAQGRYAKDSLCPICLCEFKTDEQTILSCSHVFHKVCFESFEKHTKIKACPICRKQNYDKRKTNYGLISFITKCVIKIQKLWRGFSCRKYFFEIFCRNPDNLPRIIKMKKRMISYRLMKVGRRVDKTMKMKTKVTEDFIQKMDENLKFNNESIEKQIESIYHCNEENKYQIKELLPHKKSPQIIGKQWHEIKEKGLKLCGNECTICLANLFPNKNLYLLSCCHIFHSQCIESLERYSLTGKNLCPLCRSEYEKVAMKLI